MKYALESAEKPKPIHVASVIFSVKEESMRAQQIKLMYDFLQLY